MLMKTIKTTGAVWAQSLGAVARSPLYVLALGAIAGLWGLAAYEWLWLPESSLWVLGLTVVWLLAMLLVALSMLAGSAVSASTAASGADPHLRLRKLLTFEKGRLGRTLLVVLAGTLLYLVLAAVFGWLDGHTLNVASFLTFHLQHPVSAVLITGFLWLIEAIIWILYGGFVITWLLEYSNTPRLGTPRAARQTLARSVSLSVFLTSLLSVVVFGGLVWELATWHPVVKPGGWDYTQFVIRNAAALLLIIVGWLFLVVTLAQLRTPPVTAPAEPPPAG